MFGLHEGKCLESTRFSAPLKQQRELKNCNASAKAPQVKQIGREAGAGNHAGGVVCRAATGPQSTPVLAAAVEAEVVKEDLQITIDKLPHSMLGVRVVVPQKQVAKAWSQALKHFAKNLVLEGFRKGKKVPDEMIMQKVGRPAVAEEAVNVLLSRTLPKALEEYKETIFQESLDIGDAEEMCSRIDPNREFSYECKVTLAPAVTWKEDYKNIKVEVDGKMDDAEIQKQVQKKIWASLKARGSLRVASQRGVEMGDVAVINFVARNPETGEEMPGSRQVKMHWDTTEEGIFMGMENLGENIVGMSVGETREFTQTLPQTWLDTNMRGQQILYEITVLEVLAWELPELTDEVAKQLNSGCSGVEDLTQRMDEAERMEANFTVMQRMRMDLCQELARLVQVDVSDFYFNEVASNEYQRQLLTAQDQGSLTRQEVEGLATEELLEQFKVAQREALMDSIKVTFGLEQIFEEQKLSVDQAAVQEEVETAKKESPEMFQQPDFDVEKLIAQVEDELKTSTCIEWLVANVDIQIKNNPELQKTLEDLKKESKFAPAT